MSEELKPYVVPEYPPELQQAYDDPHGDIMWRAGIARAAAILLKPRPDNALIDTLVEALASVKCDMYDSMPLCDEVCDEVEQALEEVKKWKGEV
jgi:hypothetical protein